MAKETTHVATRFEPKHVRKMHAAAKACGLPLGTWLRMVALSACGVSPLEDQLTKATRAAQKAAS